MKKENLKGAVEGTTEYNRRRKNRDKLNEDRAAIRQYIKENDSEGYARYLQDSRHRTKKSRHKKAAAKQTLKTKKPDDWERQQKVKCDYQKAAYHKRSPEQKQAASARKAAKLEALKELDSKEWDRRIKAKAAQDRASYIMRQVAKGKTVRPQNEQPIR